MIKKLNEVQKEPPYTVVKEKKPRVPFAERLTRNALLGALILLVITASMGGTDSVLRAVQTSLNQDWDERLGRLTFVSNMLPDAVAVFFPGASLTAPCAGSAFHAWSEEEPYVGYGAAGEKVYPARAGEVRTIAHGEDEEKIVELAHADGLSTIYYNLSEVLVQEGAAVDAATLLGTARAGGVLFEARRAGLPFDPTDLLCARGER